MPPRLLEICVDSVDLALVGCPWRNHFASIVLLKVVSNVRLARLYVASRLSIQLYGVCAQVC
jgi:hypothetical protein